MKDTEIPCSGDERHPMMKGKKFCGMCGRAPLEEGVTLRKCASCTEDMLKADRFCGACGEAAPAEDDLDVQLGLLKSFQAGMESGTLAADLGAIPDDDDETITPTAEERAAALLKAGTPAGADPAADVSAMPLLTALLATAEAARAGERKHAEHILKCLKPAVEGVGLLLKSQQAMGARIKVLETKIDGFGAQPRDGGPKGTIRPTLAVAGRAAADGDETLRGERLYKAATALPEAQGGLTSVEATMLLQHTNAGQGLDDFPKEGRSALAARVREVLGKQTAAA